MNTPDLLANSDTIESMVFDDQMLQDLMPLLQMVAPGSEANEQTDEPLTNDNLDIPKDAFDNIEDMPACNDDTLYDLFGIVDENILATNGFQETSVNTHVQNEAEAVQSQEPDDSTQEQGALAANANPDNAVKAAKRQKMNEAVRRCRKNKKLREQAMEQRVKELTRENNSLKKRNRELELELEIEKKKLQYLSSMVGVE